MKRRAVWTVPVFLGCVLGVLYWSGVRNIAGNGWMKQGGSFDAVEEGQYNSGKAEVEWTVGSESLKNSSTSVAEHIGEHVVVGTEDGSIPLKETVQIAEPVDYTDPFDVTRNLFYGTLDSFSQSHLSRTLDSPTSQVSDSRRRIRNPLHMHLSG